MEIVLGLLPCISYLKLGLFKKEMVQNYKILLMLLGCFFFPAAISEENTNFKNISIKADQVTLNENMSQLTFKDNIKIQIDSFIIKGSDALLSLKDKKLEISGVPASIKSDNVDGEAELFVIYPNKSMDLIGNARLLNNGNSITSNLITYQIASNE
jgi:lipopolysaccharide transport protein LptA